MQGLTRSVRSALSATRNVRHMGGGGGGHKNHVHMPETAMITNNVRLFLLCSACLGRTRRRCFNMREWRKEADHSRRLWQQGTHVFERKGWEFSTISAFIAAPIILYLGLMNVPETDSEVFAR